MTCTVALVLAAMATLLKPVHQENEALYNKRAIIQAVETKLEKPVGEMSDAEVTNVFENKIKQYAIDAEGNEVSSEGIVAAGYPGGKAEDIDMAKENKKPESDRILPVFEYSDGSNSYYILSVRGNGLWDAIWGNIALEQNFNEVAGATFDHKGETPGLGAEIKDNPNFREQFIGKEIFNDEGEFVSINVRKGGAQDPEHDVDGISGATITADGVTAMLENGLGQYLPYINKQSETVNQ